MLPPSLKRRHSNLEVGENDTSSGSTVASPVNSPEATQLSTTSQPTPKRPRQCPSPEGGEARVGILCGASDVKIYGTMNATMNVQQEKFSCLERLCERVAPNAILNAGGRVDIPRCHPGTREEVLTKMKKWISSGYRTHRAIFWLSGPAGAGKSAIMQTVAETCIQRKIPMANFFFFRADGTRNHLPPVIATLLCQLIEFFPDLRHSVDNIIGRLPHIFEKPLDDQLTILIDEPIRLLRRDAPDDQPIILLIDGLDECDRMAQLELAAISEQQALLRAINKLIAPSDSPFVAVVASRVEPHIEMEFNSIGCADESIFLNEDYRPDDDICIYLTAELSRIRTTHPQGRGLDAHWPPLSLINTVVEKSSGQFIYAATVIRFIENSAQSPAFSLGIVMKIRPVRQRSPFAEIDALYAFILARAEYWDDARNIIAMHGLYNDHGQPSENTRRVLHPPMMLYSVDDATSFFADLGSLVAAEFGDAMSLRFYHASLLDFLYSRERSGSYHIDLTTLANTLAPDIVLKCENAAIFRFAIRLMSRVIERNDDLTAALKQFAGGSWKWEDVDLVLCGSEPKDFIWKVRELYKDYDRELFLAVMKKVSQDDIPMDEEFLASLLRDD